MTGVLLYLSEARRDLEEIYRHIADANPRAAEALIRSIHTKAELLAELPHIGRSVHHLEPNLRRFPVGNYLIFYRHVDPRIEIVRVLHGARDIESLFLDDRA